MAVLKTGSTVAGNLILHQGLLPLYPAGDSLHYKNYKIYTERDKPTPQELNMFTKTQLNRFMGRLPSGSVDSWYKLGTIRVVQGGITVSFIITSGRGYNGYAYQNNTAFVTIRTSNKTDATPVNEKGRIAMRINNLSRKGYESIISGALIETSRNVYDVYFLIAPYSDNGLYSVSAASVEKLEEIWSENIAFSATAPVSNMDVNVVAMYSTDYKPTNADVGLSNVTNDAQVKKSGDTMTGRLVVEQNGTLSSIQAIGTVFNPLTVSRTEANTVSVSLNHTGGTRQLGYASDYRLTWGPDTDPNNNSTVYTSEFKPKWDDVQAWRQSISNLTGNLNDVTTPGSYYQSADVNAILSLNYPITNAGTLNVYKSNANGVGLIQEYKAYNRNTIFSRRLTAAGTWTKWSKTYTEDNRPTNADLNLVSRSGDTMTGRLIANGGVMFNTDTDLIWSRNTDYASISFKNSSDNDTDSYMKFTSGDKGNEYFKFVSVAGGSTERTWLDIKDGILTPSGGINTSLVPKTQHAWNDFSEDAIDGKKLLRGFRSRNNSTMWHETVDKGAFRIATGATDTQEEMTIEAGRFTRFGYEVIGWSPNGNQFRALPRATDKPSFILRNDGDNTYFMFTNANDQYGTWNELRPITINNKAGLVRLGGGGGANVAFDGEITTRVRSQYTAEQSWKSSSDSSRMNSTFVADNGDINTSSGYIPSFVQYSKIGASGYRQSFEMGMVGVPGDWRECVIRTRGDDTDDANWKNQEARWVFRMDKSLIAPGAIQADGIITTGTGYGLRTDSIAKRDGTAFIASDGNINLPAASNGFAEGWLLGQINNRLNTAQSTANDALNKANSSQTNAVMGVRQGGAVSPGKANEYGPNEAPDGGYLTRAWHDPGTAYGVFFTYRVLQVLINGTWRNIGR